MAWTYNGREITENDIYDIVTANYDENDFEGSLNESYPTVTICGYEYEPGTILRMVDNIAFTCAYNDECDFIAREIISSEQPTDDWGFGIEYVDNE